MKDQESTCEANSVVQLQDQRDRKIATEVPLDINMPSNDDVSMCPISDLTRSFVIINKYDYLIKTLCVILETLLTYLAPINLSVPSNIDHHYHFLIYRSFLKRD